VRRTHPSLYGPERMLCRLTTQGHLIGVLIGRNQPAAAALSARQRGAFAPLGPRCQRLRLAALRPGPLSPATGLSFATFSNADILARVKLRPSCSPRPSQACRPFGNRRPNFGLCRGERPKCSRPLTLRLATWPVVLSSRRAFFVTGFFEQVSEVTIEIAR
jgi:hypothetical protein